MLFIDELQYAGRRTRALITALHRCSQRKLPITLVGAGLPQLRHRMGRAKSYAERLFEFSEVGALVDDAARLAIEKPLREGSVGIEPQALDRIIGDTQRYPYFLQEWGKHAWDVARASPITLADVEAAASSAVAALDESFFRVRFDRSPRRKSVTCARWPDSGPARIARAMSRTNSAAR